MKAEIQKILEMNKAGTVSDEQAATLLEEIASGEKQDHSRRETGEPKQTIREKLFHELGGWGSFSGVFGNRTDGRRAKTPPTYGWRGFGETFGSPQAGMGVTDAGNNQWQISKAEAPYGKDFVFKDNRITLSKAFGIELDTAEMSGNSINASKVERIRVVEGRLSDGTINGSSLYQIDVSRSSVEGLSINASKIECLSFSAESTVKEFQINASKVDDLAVEGSSIESSGIQASRVEKTVLSKTKFTQVQIVAGEKWRWHAMTRTRFDNCVLDDVRFTGCIFKDTLFRNLTFKNLSVVDTDFSGMTIESNEAFLKVCRTDS